MGMGYERLHWLAERNRGWECAYCRRLTSCRHCDNSIPEGDPLSATIEHIIPMSLGGSRERRHNQTVACRSCNHSRGNKFIDADLALQTLLLTDESDAKRKALDDIKYAKIRAEAAKRAALRQRSRSDAHLSHVE